MLHTEGQLYGIAITCMIEQTRGELNKVLPKVILGFLMINNGQQSIHLNLPTPKIAIFSENPKNTEIRNVDSKKIGHAYV